MLSPIQKELFDNINYLLTLKKDKDAKNISICICKCNVNYYATATINNDSVQYVFLSDNLDNDFYFTVQTP